MNFEEVLAEFKGKELIEDVLPLIPETMTGQNIRLIVMAWSKIRIERISDGEIDAAKSDSEKWQWLWEQVRFDPKEIQKISGASGVLPQLEILKGNRIIYPDGAVTAFAVKVLRSYIKSQLGL